MIPLKTTIPTRKIPFITIVLILVNIIVFLYEISLQSQVNNLLQVAAVIPARYFVQETVSLTYFWPLFSSMFLHGSWMHLISNIWFLWIFGCGIEDRMGHINFLIFYLLCGIIANIVHIFINANSLIPVIGASGAIAGVLGAYMFLFPSSRVTTLVPIFFFISIVRIPAFFFLGYWFFLQFLNGLATIGQTRHIGGIAWWVHIGGFISGILLLLAFVKRRRSYR